MRLVKEIMIIFLIFILIVFIPFQIITSPSYNPEEIIEELNL